MQNLDLASTQHTEYVKCKPRAGKKVDFFLHLHYIIEVNDTVRTHTCLNQKTGQ